MLTIIHMTLFVRVNIRFVYRWNLVSLFIDTYVFPIINFPRIFDTRCFCSNIFSFVCRFSIKPMKDTMFFFCFFVLFHFIMSRCLYSFICRLFFVIYYFVRLIVHFLSVAIDKTGRPARVRLVSIGVHCSPTRMTLPTREIT